MPNLLKACENSVSKTIDDRFKDKIIILLFWELTGDWMNIIFGFWRVKNNV